MEKIIDKLSLCFEQFWEDTHDEIRINSFNGKSKEALTEEEYSKLLDMVLDNEDVRFMLMLQDLIDYPELLEELHETIRNRQYQEFEDFSNSIINDSQKNIILITRAAALEGKMSSQWLIGKMYMEGVDLVQDYELAAKWLTKSAEQGYADAEYLLGLLYSAGDGVEQSDNLALEWYSKAAEQDLADAQFLIGIMFAKGEGVPQDYESSVSWLYKAAKQDYPPAQHQLAIMYATGRGVEKDIDIAREWFTKAAELGFEIANKALKKLGT